MSSRSNFRGGRRGSCLNSHGGGGGRPGGRGRDGRGRGGGIGGEQRWWDPVWRAERLRQQAAEMEVLDSSEYWEKMQQFKSGGAEQEMIIRRNFSRHDQQTLYDMAYELGLHFHAYNKGKALVVSKVPLPDYRADLDDAHGSMQKEIRMSTETAERVGSLLKISEGQRSKKARGNVASVESGSGQGNKQTSGNGDTNKPSSKVEPLLLRIRRKINSVFNSRSRKKK